MKSRGSSYELGAGARKSLVLLWTAVLVCSVLLQYAAPAPAIAANGLLAGTVRGSRSTAIPANNNASANPGNIPPSAISGLARPMAGRQLTGTASSPMARRR